METQICQHHLSTHMSRTESKTLPGLHRSLKEAVGIPGSIHVKAEAGPGAQPEALSCTELLTAVQRKEHRFCLSFSLRQRLFSEGHGPAMVLRTSHVLSISQAQELARLLSIRRGSVVAGEVPCAWPDSQWAGTEAQHSCRACGNSDVRKLPS